MNHLLFILLTALLCATASAQTIKTLGYNSTNGQVVAATNVVWTNAFGFSTNTVAASVRTNLDLGATWLTNTNVTNFRTAVGLGVDNIATLQGLELTTSATNADLFIADQGDIVGDGDLFISAGALIFQSALEFSSNSVAATTRTNLGLPLVALTNTSNVTMMRALAGSTNTNEPHSGVIELTDGTTNYELTFSNGILLKIISGL